MSNSVRVSETNEPGGAAEIVLVEIKPGPSAEAPQAASASTRVSRRELALGLSLVLAGALLALISVAHLLLSS